jgi:hypothetical protein
MRNIRILTFLCLVELCPLCGGVFVLRMHCVDISITPAFTPLVPSPSVPDHLVTFTVVVLRGQIAPTTEFYTTNGLGHMIRG